VAIVNASELYSALRGVGQGHAGASAFPGDALIGNDVVLGFAAKVLGRNLLQFHDGVARHRVRRASHGMGRLASSGWACPWQVLRRVAPRDIALFPRHAEEFSDHTMHVSPGFRSQIADSGLDIDPSVGLDDEQPIESGGATGVTADRYT